MHKLLLLVFVLFCFQTNVITTKLLLMYCGFVKKKCKNITLEMNYNLSNYVDEDSITECVMLLFLRHRSGEVT